MASGLAGVALSAFLLWVAWVSRREGESQAAVRLTVTAILTLGVFAVPLVMEGTAGGVAAGALLCMLLFLGGALLMHYPGRRLTGLGVPVPGVDERDIMFSRAELVPGTDRFRDYYGRHPEHRKADDGFRREPGLMAWGASHFHRLGFAAADAAFWTIERLRPFVEGDSADGKSGAGRRSSGGWAGDRPESGATGVRLGGGSAGVGPGRMGPEELPVPGPAAVTRFLKAWALKMGAHSVGVTRVRDYHLYTHVGRGSDYGKEVILDHPFALALTVEMDKEMVDRAPSAPTVMESGLQYLLGGVMAVQMADSIRRLGYRARAHIDGNYRVICPLVAQDAGLGVLGRMGLLMTPSLGPRVRIAVVTTDLPLAVDSPSQDPTTVDFCLRCRKCASACPSRAISFDPPEKDENGVLRWRIDAESCFTFWTRVGTDCARCMAVCPYSHPDNLLHGMVRWGIRHNLLFRRVAVKMDDLIYGGPPPPKAELPWMAESNGDHDRSISRRTPPETEPSGD